MSEVMERPEVRTATDVIELRQYTLHPGRRDELIALFEANFVESQEAAGMTLIGQFRDLDRPDCFVWLRGFRDMESRRRALSAFYGGPVWREHRDAANATMIDSDDVLLLKPAWPGSGFRMDGMALPAVGASLPGDARIVVCLHYFDGAISAEWLEHFRQVQRPWLEELHARVLAACVIEDAPNTFPALPVRAGEQVFACFLRFDDEATHERCDRQLQAPWRIGTQPRASEILRLIPTSRSRLGR